MPSKSRDLDAHVDVQRIRAIEVYAMPGEVPAEFLADARCGAVVIWTHQSPNTVPRGSLVQSRRS
jgi:hypothetical protein